MHIEYLLFVSGGVILLGFASRFIFEKTQIPDVLLLMAAGVLMGHFLGAESRWYVFQFAPYFGTLALIMILFEAGLRIEARDAYAQLPPALLLALLTFLVSTGLITAVMHWALEWSWLHATLLGVALGCTSSAIVLPLMPRITSSEDTRALLTLEAVFSDTLAVVAMLIVLEFAVSGQRGFMYGLTHLATSFGVAAVIAILVGSAWLIVLEFTRHRPLSYLLTFAVLLMLYGLVERLRGSGAIAVLVFGLLTTEAKHLPKWILLFRPAPARWREEAHETVQWFHEELTFLVRTFFFVYLGLLVESERFTQDILLYSVVLSGIILVSRGVVLDLARKRIPQHSPRLLRALIPRGLVSAVLVAMPHARGIQGTGSLIDYVVPVIIITNIMTGWRLFLARWRASKTQGTPPPMPAPSPPPQP